MFRAGELRRLATDNALLTSMTLTSSALNLLFQLVMARTLEPGHDASSVALIGLFAIAVVPGSVMATVATKVAGDLRASGNTSGLPQRYRRAAWLGVVGGGVAGVLGFALGPPVASLLSTTDTWGTGWALAGFGFSIVAAAPRGVALGLQRFGRMGSQLVVEAGVRIALGSVLIALGFGIGGALGGVAMALLLSGVVGLALMRR